MVLGPAPHDEPDERGEDEYLDNAEDGPPCTPRGLFDEDGEDRDHQEAERCAPAAGPGERCSAAAHEPVGDGRTRAHDLQSRPRRSDSDAEQHVVRPGHVRERQEQEARAAEQRTERHAEPRAAPVEQRAEHHPEPGGDERGDGERAGERRAAPAEIVLHRDDEQAEEVAGRRTVSEEREERDADDPPSAEGRVEGDASCGCGAAHRTGTLILAQAAEAAMCRGRTRYS